VFPSAKAGKAEDEALVVRKEMVKGYFT